MGDKSSRWSFTAYAQQWPLFTQMPPSVAEWGWQTEECPDTGREHYQGYVRTSTQQRFGAMKKLFPGVHLEIAKNWDALKAYCNKQDTAIPGTQVTEKSDYMNKFQFLDYIIKKAIKEYDRDILLDMCEAEFISTILLLSNYEILAGRTYIAWIISDPNFKLTLKQSGKALVIHFS